MNEAEIDAMPAGCEMDVAVSEHLFGKVPAPVVFRDGTRGMGIPGCPPYSTEIASAWRVVDKMRSMGLWMMLDADEDGFKCSFSRPSRKGLEADATCPEVELSICRAALKAAVAGAVKTG